MLFIGCMPVYCCSGMAYQSTKSESVHNVIAGGRVASKEKGKPNHEMPFAFFIVQQSQNHVMSSPSTIHMLALMSISSETTGSNSEKYQRESRSACLYGFTNISPKIYQSKHLKWCTQQAKIRIFFSLLSVFNILLHCMSRCQHILTHFPALWVCHAFEKWERRQKDSTKKHPWNLLNKDKGEFSPFSGSFVKVNMCLEKSAEWKFCRRVTQLTGKPRFIAVRSNSFFLAGSSCIYLWFQVDFRYFTLFCIFLSVTTFLFSLVYNMTAAPRRSARPSMLPFLVLSFRLSSLVDQVPSEFWGRYLYLL